MRGFDSSAVGSIGMNGETVSQAEQLKRRSQRLMLRIPIDVSGTGPDGAPFKERTYTLEVNRHGARIAMTTSVRLQTAVNITNTTNMNSCAFTIVSRIEKSLSGIPEWGVESAEAEPDFWGVRFPDDGPRPSPREVAAAFRPGAASAPSAVGDDRRRATRVDIKLPVRVRVEEVGETENISTTGVCFTSTLDLKIGDRVKMTVGYTPGSNQKELAARVVWKRRTEKEGRALYGAELEEGM